MSASALARGPATAAQRWDALAYGLLAALPLGMAIANRSAQPILAAAAVAALLGRAQGGELRLLRNRLLRLASTRLGAASLAFAAFAALALLWSHEWRASGRAYAEAAGAGLAALLLHAALPRRIPGWVVKLAAVALAIGCLVIVAEIATGVAMRAGLGFRSYPFIFKRSVTAMLPLFWPLAVLLWLTERRSLAAALGILLAIATFEAHSSATALGFAAGFAALAAAAVSPRWTARLLAGAVVLAFALAPVIGDAAIRLVPAATIDKLQFAHGRDRIELWQSFGEVVKLRPLAGAGFGTSPTMARAPVAAEVPAERRRLLAGWHPHNGYLQIWAELGFLGATLAAAALALTALRVGRAGPPAALSGAAVLAAAAAVMTVGHGVWQGWWLTVLGAAAIWIARLPAAVESERARAGGQTHQAAGPPRKPVAST